MMGVGRERRGEGEDGGLGGLMPTGQGWGKGTEDSCQEKVKKTT